MLLSLSFVLVGSVILVVPTVAVEIDIVFVDVTVGMVDRNVILASTD